MAMRSCDHSKGRADTRDMMYAYSPVHQRVHVQSARSNSMGNLPFNVESPDSARRRFYTHTQIDALDRLVASPGGQAPAGRKTLEFPAEHNRAMIIGSKTMVNNARIEGQREWGIPKDKRS